MSQTLRDSTLLETDGEGPLFLGLGEQGPDAVAARPGTVPGPRPFVVEGPVLVILVESRLEFVGSYVVRFVVQGPEVLFHSRTPTDLLRRSRCHSRDFFGPGVGP